MDYILNQINKLEEHGIKNISMIALISDTSSEVVFYCDYNNCRVQSNSLVEEYGIDSMIIEGFYSSITDIIRNSKDFKTESMNIVKVIGESIEVSYEEKTCRTYKIIKEWSASSK